MKIVIFGLCISSSWGNGHATLWRGLCRSLARNRHTVVFYERNTPYYAVARDYREIPGGELVLYENWGETRMRAVADLAEADAGIVTSYCPDAIAATDIVLGGRAIPIFYDLDTPVTLGRLRRGEPLSYIGARGLSDFALVLSYTGGPALAELRDRLGARLVLPLYGHVDPDLHHPVAAVDRYAADLSYLGTFAIDRQAALETLFIEPARRRPARRFLLGGAQYPHDFPWTQNIFFVRHLPPGEHSAFFSSSRLTLNITRRDMVEMGWCPSGRLFEAAACGAAILSDCWEGLDAFFSPPREVLVAANCEDATAALELDESQIRSVAAAARERALTDHTSECRADELLRAIARVSVQSRAPEPLEA
jgi:spore maturation protein CgeB